MRHIHKFKNIGGGMNMIDGGEFPCDDDYKCECGILFTLKSTITGHRYLPESWEYIPSTEIKQAELDTIGDVLMGNLPPIISTPNDNK